MPVDSAMATSGLTKRYGDSTAVDSLSLRVRRGEIYGFLGLNGAGKTTTIRMLLGMVRPSGGTAHVFGTPVHAGARNLWSRVGYLVETPYAYPELTVRENLEAVRRLRRIADPRAVDRTMERLALTDYADHRARSHRATPRGWGCRRLCCTSRSCSFWMSPRMGWTRPAWSRFESC